MRDVASSLHHSLHPSGTPSLLPILYLHHLLAAELDIPEAIRRLRRGYYLLLLDLVVRLERVLLLLLRDSQDLLGHGVDCSFVDTWRPDRAAVRAEMRLRLHRTQVAASAADDLAIQHIMRTQALELEHALTHWRTLVAVPRLWL
ncbi:hypothetical protein Tco_1371149 [Tanacetum coccineum]